MATTSDVTAATITIGVLTEHTAVRDNPWITERWRAIGVVAGEHFGGARERRPTRTATEVQEYLWTGFELRLTKSQADSYYFNLVGANPSVYVLGHVDDDGEFVPTEVSVDYIDALSRAETGADTFVVPMPPEVYRMVEEFVLANYEPEERRPKRKHDIQPENGDGRRH
jgi:Protein of unknown function (DUF3305)